MRGAAEADLRVCRYCRTVTRLGEGTACPVCGDALRLRQPRQLQRVWAFWIAALTAYVPANLLPIMGTSTLGRVEYQTILGGVFELLAHHDTFVAVVVFTASILVPTVKFVAIAWLAIAAQRPGFADPHRAGHVHHWVELVGRWSMIDVFVVAVLVALVRLGAVASVVPGPGIVAFAGTVILSMLSAAALDPRGFWDASRPEGKPA